MPPPDVRVLILASDPLVRSSLAALLTSQPGCAVVGQAALQDEVSEAVSLYRPEVILWDFGWDAETSLDHLPDLREAHTPVVALLPDDTHAAKVWGAGARGLLLRDADATKLLSAISAAAHGLATLEPSLAVAVTSPEASPDESTPSLPLGDLTSRELEVLRLLAEGLPNKAIAHQLTISEHTVKFHVNAILSKLGAQSRTEAVTRASRMGLILL